MHWDVVATLAGAAILLTALLAVIVYLPQFAIDPHGLTRDQWLTHVQDLRTTILQGLGGLAVLVGAVIAALNLRETSRQNRAVQEQSRAVLEETSRQNRAVQEQNRAVLELQRRGQTTERFTRAIEQLGQQGPEKLDVRIGAVYALEQIARDSAELHWPIMEVLTAYLREHAPVRAPADAVADDSRPKRLPADHQAIATVIGRRRREQDPEGERLDLLATDLPGVRWVGAHLEGAVLDEAHLEGALLDEAHLEGALLREAHLEEAWLNSAHLQGALLREAHLEGAYLVLAHLEGASFKSAHLEEAELLLAHLEGAWLGEALGLSPEQLRAAADPERADLSPEQEAWLAPAAEAPPEAGSEGGPEASGEGRS